LPRAKPAHCVPPSGFAYPLGGLLPRIPCRFCFTPAALMGFTLRRFPLPRGFHTFRLGKTHLPLARQYFRRRSVGPARQAPVPGFTPPGIALRPHGVLSQRPPAPPLGFPPLGSDLRKPCPGLLRVSSRVLNELSRLLTEPAYTSECQSAFASP